MAFKLNKNDRKLLASIAEYRILTVGQIAALSLKSKQVVRKRLRKLAEKKLVQISERGFGYSRGRPERLASLALGGIGVLHANGTLDANVSIDKITAEKLTSIDHQMLVNWFWIHLLHIPKVVHQLSAQFLSPTSPFLKRDEYDRPFVFERVPSEKKTDKITGFTPDGVFSITNNEWQKTLLFFLEVDMGTETVASPKRDPRDVRQKIRNYQLYFKTGRYKRYEKIWNCQLHGIRLLLFTNSNERMVTICRLIRQMPPSDFVWSTDQKRMFSQGLSSEIWARGGKHEAPLQSILGAELARPTPIPAKE